MEKRISDRVQKALNKAEQDFDFICEVHDDIEYVEVNGSQKGAMKCIRYYDDGIVTDGQDCTFIALTFP